MATWIPILVSAGTLFLAICVAVVNWVHLGNEKASSEANERENLTRSLTKLDVKLDSINTTVKETRADVKSMDSRLQSVDKRVTILERDQNTLWEKFDEIHEEALNNQQK